MTEEELKVLKAAYRKEVIIECAVFISTWYKSYPEDRPVVRANLKAVTALVYVDMIEKLLNKKE